MENDPVVADSHPAPLGVTTAAADVDTATTKRRMTKPTPQKQMTPKKQFTHIVFNLF